jgi:hypothetical protein
LSVRHAFWKTEEDQIKFIAGQLREQRACGGQIAKDFGHIIIQAHNGNETGLRRA